MSFFKKAPAAKMFTVPDSFHELLQEREPVRAAVYKVIDDFFNQKSDDVAAVKPCFPLVQCDPNTSIYSFAEFVVRGAGLAMAAAGCIAGLAMMFGDRRKY